MKYFIVAGERSGDLHGGSLIQQLALLDKEATFKCYGGEEMEKAGAEVLVHYKELAFMGFLEVINNINSIFSRLTQCKKELKSWQPNVVILIDYPGFNLKIAKYARNAGVQVHYYISPKVWAWNQKRIKSIKKYVDHLYSILPFEKEFYAKHDFDIQYVGNPLINRIGSHQFDKTINGKFYNKTCISILPGSRIQEVLSMNDTISVVIDNYPNIEFLICAVSNIPSEHYSSYAMKPNVTLIWDQPYDALHISKAAIVNSGTATLETALLNVPQVICYRTSFLTYQIAKLLIKVEYIGLVNLIANKEIVKELIQSEFNAPNLIFQLNEILNSKDKRDAIKNSYTEMKNIIGDLDAPKLVAESVISSITVK